MRSAAAGLLLPMLALVACGTDGHFAAYAPPPTEPGSWPQVVTNLDFVGVGNTQAWRFVDALPAAERAATKAMLGRVAPACVRIEVLVASSGSAATLTKGSGVVLQGGAGGAVRVGTAGHVLSAGDVQRAWIVSAAGETLASDASTQEYVQFGSSDRDWGLIQLASPPRRTVALATALPVAGELAFVLAYPDGVGIDAQGRVVYGKAVAAAPLQPLLTVAEVTAPAPLQLRPLAGAIPLGGASGSAIVNRRGEVIGLFNAVVASFDDAGTTFWLHGASTAALPDSAPR